MGNAASSQWADQLTFVPNQREQPYLRLHHVPIFVRNQDRSLRFYLEQLGFSLVIDYHFGKHGRFVLVAPPDGDALLALIAPKPESEEYKLIGHSGECAVFVTEDVNAKFDTWRDRGVGFRHPPQAGAWGGVFTVFDNLDGNSFVLAGWDDITQEIEAQRRTLAEKSESERRAAQELEIAKQVQARLFPQTAPALKTLGGQFSLCATPRRRMIFLTRIGPLHPPRSNLPPSFGKWGFWTTANTVAALHLELTPVFQPEIAGPVNTSRLAMMWK